MYLNFVMFIFYSNKILDLCHLAKQHKLPFPISVHTVSHAFDLVYMEIWGSLNIPSIHGHRYFLRVTHVVIPYAFQSSNSRASC
ncbi:hypothetical protein CR513_09147, partial [Mucuna pruriens]